MSKPVSKAKTVSPQNSIVKATARPDAEFHMLVGGPYVAGGEEHRYGHAAVRIKTPNRDTTYDFGRYGAVTGDFGAEGEGILRAWSNFAKYIAGENVLKRTTTGFVYRIFTHHTRPVFEFFDRLVAVGARRPSLERGRSWVQVYQLTRNYHALGPNCTTISLDAAAKIWPQYEDGSDRYIDSSAVLNFAERAALSIAGTPARIFLPANLKSFLESTPPIRVDRVDKYP